MFPFPVPQMMPCSWLIIFFIGMMIFSVFSSSWSNFFFISGFCSSKSKFNKRLVFWN